MKERENEIILSNWRFLDFTVDVYTEVLPPQILGGRKVGKKLGVQEQYLRAAALVLWKFHKANKDEEHLNELIADARTVIGIGQKEASQND